MLHKPISKMWLLYVCLLACLGGCKQCTEAPTPTKLPDATQIGANTFGCMLNGNLWVARGSYSGFPAGPNPNVSYDATYLGGTLQGGAAIVVDGKEQSNIIIEGSNISALGEYTPKNSNILFSYRNFVNTNEPFFYSNEGTPNYKLIITKNDLQSKIISGTFSFSIEKNGYKVVITDGRFDIKYL